MCVARRVPLTDKRVDGQCDHRVEQARRFLSASRVQSPRTGGGDHSDAEEEEGREEEALSAGAYVERRGRAALPQGCLLPLQSTRCYRPDITIQADNPLTQYGGAVF